MALRFVGGAGNRMRMRDFQAEDKVRLSKCVEMCLT
jgi:hypothetical protein